MGYFITIVYQNGAFSSVLLKYNYSTVSLIRTRQNQNVFGKEKVCIRRKHQNCMKYMF